MSGLGALAKLMKAIKEGYLPTDEIKAVGETFSKADPQTYFRTTPSPANSMAEAEDRYGVGMKWIDENQLDAWLKSDPDALAEVEILRKIPNRKWFAGLPSLDKPVYTIDSGRLFPGSGAGSRIYPALFDSLSDDYYNISTGLSDVNKMRRSLNMADAIIRSPKLGNSVLPGPDQFDALAKDREHSYRLLPWYMSASNLERLGALELNAALQGQDWLRQGFTGSIGPSTLKKFQIVEDTLQGDTPSELLRLGLKRGGLARIQHARQPMSRNAA